MRHPRTILITGASSGIGEALALDYATPGVRLLLTGRDAARLESAASACRDRGASVEAARIDVTDGPALRDWIEAQDEKSPIDLVIANAGMSAGTGEGDESEAQARAIFAVNLDGMLNTVHPLIPRMVARGRGQIGIMSSVAGFRGLPGAPAYCAAKAAVRVYGEALRVDLAAKGIGLSVICPGFVRTRMTAVNRFPMPFLMDADRAARIIRRGLARNRARIGFPWPTFAFARLLALIPPAWLDPILARAPRKS